jgi:hypothetical protein
MGLSKAQVNQLLALLKTEGQKALGREMIFEVRPETFSFPYLYIDF